LQSQGCNSSILNAHSPLQGVSLSWSVLKQLSMSKLGSTSRPLREHSKRLHKTGAQQRAPAVAHSGAPMPRRYATTALLSSVMAYLRGVSPSLQGSE
jgi:hypothetical protein